MPHRTFAHRYKTRKLFFQPQKTVRKYNPNTLSETSEPSAREKGDLLIVGLNSDQSVKSIKGNDRPIKTQKERANIISALKSVDYITIFNETTPEEMIRQVRPDILVKGDDYNKHEVAGREIVEGYGAKVELIPIVKGLSTTNIVTKILENHKSN